MILLWHIICDMIKFYRRSWQVLLPVSLALFVAGFNTKPALLLFVLAGIIFVITIAMVVSDVKDCRSKDREEKYNRENPHLH